MFWGLEAGQLSLLFWGLWAIYNLYCWISRVYREVTCNLRQLSDAIRTQNQNIKPIHIENKATNPVWSLLAGLIPTYVQMFVNAYSSNPSKVSPALDVLSKIFGKNSTSPANNTSDENNYKNTDLKFSHDQPFNFGDYKMNLPSFVVHQAGPTVAGGNPVEPDILSPSDFYPKPVPTLPPFTCGVNRKSSLCDLDLNKNCSYVPTGIRRTSRLGRGARISQRCGRGGGDIRSFIAGRRDENNQKQNDIPNIVDSDTESDLDDNSSRKASKSEYPNNSVKITSVAI